MAKSFSVYSILYLQYFGWTFLQHGKHTIVFFQCCEPWVSPLGRWQTSSRLTTRIVVWLLTSTTMRMVTQNRISMTQSGTCIFAGHVILGQPLTGIHQKHFHIDQNAYSWQTYKWYLYPFYMEWLFCLKRRNILGINALVRCYVSVSMSNMVSVWYIL